MGFLRCNSIGYLATQGMPLPNESRTNAEPPHAKGGFLGFFGKFLPQTDSAGRWPFQIGVDTALGFRPPSADSTPGYRSATFQVFRNPGFSTPRHIRPPANCPCLTGWPH